MGIRGEEHIPFYVYYLPFCTTSLKQARRVDNRARIESMLAFEHGLVAPAFLYSYRWVLNAFFHHKRVFSTSSYGFCVSPFEQNENTREMVRHLASTSIRTITLFFVIVAITATTRKRVL